PEAAQEPLCSPSQPSLPFDKIFYTTDANANGDRLVVGHLRQGFEHLDGPHFLNQQYCDQIELACGIYANAYVPTAEKKNVSLSDFAGLLVDPTSHAPFPFGIIPRDRRD